MKRVIRAACLLTGLAIRAQGAEEVGLPMVLIIGDSISMGYTKPLEEILKGKATVVHNPGNAGHSRNGLAKLDSWLGETRWDVIHFNHGLHDLKYVNDAGTNSNTEGNAHVQVPLDEYRKNMEAIVNRLQRTGARLIFATTTPFPGGVRPLRIPEDAEKYNAVALDIMKQHGIAVNDLFAFALPRLEKLQRPKNVHFTPAGSKALAEEVAKHIVEALGQPSPAGGARESAPEATCHDQAEPGETIPR